jgi:hypothetical protein
MAFEDFVFLLKKLKRIGGFEAVGTGSLIIKGFNC